MLDFDGYKWAEEANYHFALADLVDHIEIHGFEQVVNDLKDCYHARLMYAQATSKTD